MKRYLGLAFCITAVSALILTSCGPKVIKIEEGIDRGGMDYRNYTYDTRDPVPCAETCQKEPECKAFTVILQGDTSHCWLKNGVPEPREEPSAVSGVK